MNETAARATDKKPAPEARDFIRIGASSTSFPASAAEARTCFHTFHAVQIPKLLDPRLEETVLKLIATAAFGSDPASTTEPALQVPGSREVEVSPQRVGRVLNLAFNRPDLLRWLENVTGCAPLGSFEGRLAQTQFRPGDELHWHDDYVEHEGREVAIVLNLSTATFEGGEFWLRAKGEETLFEHRYTELGSALLFEVSRGLEHCVRPLTSGGPRRVFAGWAFQAGRGPKD